MNWTALMNLAISAVAVGVSVFMVMAFQEGVPTSASLSAAITAGIAAIVQHIRNSPFFTPSV